MPLEGPRTNIYPYFLLSGLRGVKDAPGCLVQLIVTGLFVPSLMKTLYLFGLIPIYVLRAFLDQDSGGLMDRVGQQNDIGLMKEILKSLEINCAAVCVLVRLGEITSNVEFHERAISVLSSQIQMARKQGISAGSLAVTVLTLDI